MAPRTPALLFGLALLLASVGTANAGPITTYDFGGSGDPSLHGATGSLSIEDLGGGNYEVIWTIDTTGFDDADATATGHTLLTDVAFKISGMTSVALDDPTVGTLYYPTNINSGTDGCDTGGSPAGFACVILNPSIDATTDQVFSVTFNVTGDLDLSEGVSFRGKYGEAEGWVISEDSEGMVPEPSAAVVFGLGALLIGRRSRRRR